jgi:hypothetical protein
LASLIASSCGVQVNHQCPYEIESSTRSIATQLFKENYDAATHPFLKGKLECNKF